MAIVILQEPAAFSASAQEQFFRVETTLATPPQLMSMEILDDGFITVATMYANIYNGVATFSLGGIIGSLFDKWNPIWFPTVAGQRVQALVDETNKKFTFQFHCVGEAPVNSGTKRFIRGYDTGSGKVWNIPGFHGTLGYQKPPTERIARRDLVLGQAFPLTMFSTFYPGSFPLEINGLFVTAYPSSGNQHVILWIQPFENQVEFALGSPEDSESQGKLILNIENKCYPRAKTLYWLNRMGGWDFYSFIDSEQTLLNEATRSWRWTSPTTRELVTHQGDNKVEMHLTGRLRTSEWHMHLKDLLTSPRVFDETGTPVNVLDTDIVFSYAGMQAPKVRIEYLSQGGTY